MPCHAPMEGKGMGREEVGTGMLVTKGMTGREGKGRNGGKGRGARLTAVVVNVARSIIPVEQLRSCLHHDSLTPPSFTTGNDPCVSPSPLLTTTKLLSAKTTKEFEITRASQISSIASDPDIYVATSTSLSKQELSSSNNIPSSQVGKLAEVELKRQAPSTPPSTTTIPSI
ncbi:hypothetical protein V500_03997 [Pseudogymnoascus sp. VKM F-4518 (FW-2643)]|nr:hypothetical protein V500_03997 [Pseudogymnoascus sp. VKM F-4518 (FW-2643)]